jgi:hypothetical protein
VRHPTPERYDVHELLRQYAEEQLDAAGEAECARSAQRISQVLLQSENAT